MNNKHYVPILKWKRAEQSALKELGEKEKKLLTPLIELVMPTVSLNKTLIENGEKKTVRKAQEEISAEIIKKFKEKRVKEIPEEILQFWGTKPVFLDFTLLYGETQLKIDSLNEVIPAGKRRGLKIIPIVNLNDEQKIKSAIAALAKDYDQGICLRVTPSDLGNSDALKIKSNDFLNNFGLSAKNVDLLIDIKENRENGGHYIQYLNATQGIKDLKEWRNFIFASGAFPENLSECKLDEPTFLPRFDWQNWLSFAREKKLVRNPVFADYSIRTPIFKEALQYYQSTPSIKYTFKNDWLIMKGELRKNYHYLTNAKLLVEDTNYFSGEQFSWGDKNIAEKAKYYHQYMDDIKKGKIKEGEGKGTGRSTDWIAWSINHHLILVLNQIANLP